MLCLFGDPVLVLRCFCSFLLLLIEYCSPVWMSVAASHFGLLDRVELKAVRLSDCMVVCDLEHRRLVAALCISSKIYCYFHHTLEAALSRVHVPARLTRLAVSVHFRCLAVPRCSTVQFGRSFVPACVQLWHSLNEPCLAGDGVAAFKFQINRVLLFE